MLTASARPGRTVRVNLGQTSRLAFPYAGVGCAGAVSGVTINGHAWSDTEVVYPASGKAMLRVSNIGATQEEAIGG